MASVLTRAKVAIQVFRTGQSPWGKKSTPFLWPTYRQGAPEWHLIDTQAYIEEGFNLNSLIYSAIMYKVRSQVVSPLRAYTGETKTPVLLPPGRPLSDLCLRPNPAQSWAEFHSQSVVYLNLTGNCFIVMRRSEEGVLPEEMYSLRPDRVHIVPGATDIKGFLYVPEGKSPKEGLAILPQDMMHIKLPNPGDPLEGMGYGLSPVSALARSADVDNKITEFLKVFFDRGTVLSGLLKFEDPLEPDTISEIRERWKEIYGGYGNWAEVGILDQGGDYQRISMTFDEMGFEGIDERNESRVLGPFGVPPILIGSRIGLLRSTYCLPANARISTSRGLVEISSIEPGELVWSFVDGKLEENCVTWSGCVGRKKLYEIKTKNRTLRATGNHPVLVRVPGNNKVGPNHTRQVSYDWRRVDKLTVGDYVVQPKNYPFVGIPATYHGAEFTEEHYKFFGAIIGDGTVGDGHVQMSIPPTDNVYGYYTALVPGLFDKTGKCATAVTACLNCGKEIETTLYRARHGKARFCSDDCKYAAAHKMSKLPARVLRVCSETREPAHVCVCERSFTFASTKWCGRLRGLGLGGRAHTKRVPWWVYQSREKERLAFLAGIVDTDGHIDKRGALQVGFTSEDLTHDVRHLLISVGIQCSNVKRYVRTPDVLPNPGTKDEYDFYSFVASSAKKVAEIPFVNSVYRERVNNNEHRFKADGKDACKAGLDDCLGFYKVVSVRELGKEPVYDIAVEGSHSFVADGVVVHNSNYELARKAFWEDTMVPEIKLFEAEFQYCLRDANAFVAFDMSGVPALQKDVPAQIDAWAKLVDRGISKMAAATTVGLRLEEVPDGEEAYTVGLTPIGTPPIPKLPSDAPPATKGGEGSGHRGHTGLPGVWGGSRPTTGPTTEQIAEPDDGEPLPWMEPAPWMRPRETEHENFVSSATAPDDEGIGESSYLGRGIAGAVMVYYVDDGYGVWKAVYGSGSRHEGDGEVIAYEISEMLGLHIVPKTIFSELDGADGTSQFYIATGVEGGLLDFDQEDSLLHNTDMESFALLDHLTGNLDRHGGNWLMDEDYNIWAIDHGHAGFGLTYDTALGDEYTQKFLPIESVYQREHTFSSRLMKNITKIVGSPQGGASNRNWTGYEGFIGKFSLELRNDRDSYDKINSVWDNLVQLVTDDGTVPW